MTAFTKDWRLYFSIGFMMLVILTGFVVSGEADRADRTLDALERSQARADRLEKQVDDLQGQVLKLQVEVIRLTREVSVDGGGRVGGSGEKEYLP